MDKYPNHNHHSQQIYSTYHTLRPLHVINSLNIQHSKVSVTTAPILHMSNLRYRDIKQFAQVKNRKACIGVIKPNSEIIFKSRIVYVGHNLNKGAVLNIFTFPFSLIQT